MRFPIKLKSELLHASLRRILPNKADPRPLLTGTLASGEFSRLVSSICVEGVWKTTKVARHHESNQLLLRNLPSVGTLRVIDVGISDGVTTADLVETLSGNYDCIYATDLCLSLYAAERGDSCYFYRDRDGPCIMAVGRRLMFYESVGGSLNVLRRISASVRSKAPLAEVGRRVELVNPRLLTLVSADERLKLMEWNMFSPWPHGPVSLIRTANVLNLSYFGGVRIQHALANLANALVEGGRLLVVDNRDIESATLAEKAGGRWKIIAKVGRECDVDPFLGTSFVNPA